MLLVFGILPVLVAAIVSLTNMDIGDLASPTHAHFIGLQNYRQLFGDSAFWQALRNTVLFVAVGVPVIMVISLAIALGLSRSESRLYRALRALYFLPAITAIVAISLIWGYLYNSQFGVLNYLLSTVGVSPVEWLGNSNLGRASVAAVGIWRATGLDIIIFLAAIMGVPQEYSEAAAIDGAGRWRTTFSVTIPLIRYALFFVAVTTVINWLQFFDEAFVLNQGRPNPATTSLSLYIYQEGFKFNQFGFASAGSVALFALIAAVTALQLRLRKSDD
ncbi:MAG: multiple sugar transport system permease protein [Frankiales bacterium]|jgi:multiple sugar transport system permease protein|nr:multiple sugar transport system permease protein [Frankiales bacterium]